MSIRNSVERYNLTVEGVIVAFVAMWLGNVGGYHAAATGTALPKTAGLLFMIVGGFVATLMSGLATVAVVYLFEQAVGGPKGESA